MRESMHMHFENANTTSQGDRDVGKPSQKAALAGSLVHPLPQWEGQLSCRAMPPYKAALATLEHA